MKVSLIDAVILFFLLLVVALGFIPVALLKTQ